MTPRPRQCPDRDQANVRTLAPLVEQVRALVQSARRLAARSVHAIQVMTNFEIGRIIVEHEQAGAARAQYGKETLEHLSAALLAEFGRGFSRANLQLMRNFYLLYRERFPEIRQTGSGESPAGDAVRETSGLLATIRQTPSGESIGELPPFTLSWSHYVLLISIRNPQERSFYEIEAARGDWPLAELKRQVASSLYERLALGRDERRIRQLAEEGHLVEKPADLFKQPYVLEFLGLREEAAYSETDLESAIVGRLQQFLLELGKGFLFEARQKRFTFDEDHFFVDLVFYNRLLRCYVLIDLKIDKLTHQDLGQMQMYVNYFDRHVRTPGENPTVGILLCRRKNDALVEITLPPDANIHAAEYRLYLPSKDELRAKLLEWTREADAS